MAQPPMITLSNGVEMPQLGFGVFQVPPDEVYEPVTLALEAGYRLVDTAAAYRNEEGVGKAIANSGIARDELFVTTKLWNADHGFSRALAAFERSAERLGLDVVDLYLIHWPLPVQDDYVETWRALEQLYHDGRVRAIGLSNFTEQQIRRLRSETEVVPVLDQVELHPGFPQAPLRSFLTGEGIATEAWSPLGQGEILGDGVITRIAAEHGRTPAQVVLRWHIELGNIVIPKSVTPERIEENIAVFDFELGADEIDAITAIGSDRRQGPDPEQFDLGARSQ